MTRTSRGSTDTIRVPDVSISAGRARQPSRSPRPRRAGAAAWEFTARVADSPALLTLRHVRIYADREATDRCRL
jgi:hypothetical protein